MQVTKIGFALTIAGTAFASLIAGIVYAKKKGVA